jgi:hypothetical protein
MSSLHLICFMHTITFRDSLPVNPQPPYATQVFFLMKIVCLQDMKCIQHGQYGLVYIREIQTEGAFVWEGTGYSPLELLRDLC